MQTDVDHRIRFVDVARGLAVLLMIAVHATDAFLADVWRTGWLYHQISILYGFVAPVFIFFSGYTLHIALQRRKISGRSSRDLGLRASGVLLLGYWLQIPSHSLRNALDASPMQIERFFDCNVLGVIGLSSLLVLALHAGARDTGRRTIVTGVLGGLIILATPYIVAIPDINTLPLPVRFYISPDGSFPIFPWTGYFCIGFSIASRMNSWSRHRAFAMRATLIGVGMMLLARGVSLVGYGASDAAEFWQHGPLLFLFRTGGILVISAISQALIRRADSRTTWLERAGQASLLIYVLHLMLIYGSPITKGMRYWYGNVLDRSLDPLVVAGLAVAVTGAVWGGVLFWKSYRGRWPRSAYWLVRVWWAGFLIFFLLS